MGNTKTPADKPQAVHPEEKKYTKEQFLKSTDFKRHRDLLDALLKDGVLYSRTEAEQAINKYFNQGVE